MKKLDVPYYLELQRRLEDIILYVACHEDNFNCYSVKIENLFVDTCAFFDSLCQTFIKDLSERNFNFQNDSEIKKFSKKVRGKEYFNIEDYRLLLKDEFDFGKSEIIICPYTDYFLGNIMHLNPQTLEGYTIKPFKKWHKNEAPFWWKSYTSLKHNRLENIEHGNLKNTLYAIAGTFIVLAIKNKEKFKNGDISPKIYELFFPLFWESRGRKIPGVVTFN